MKSSSYVTLEDEDFVKVDFASKDDRKLLTLGRTVISLSNEQLKELEERIHQILGSVAESEAR